MTVACKIQNSANNFVYMLHCHLEKMTPPADPQLILDSFLFLCLSNGIRGSCGLAKILSDSIVTFLGKP